MEPPAISRRTSADRSSRGSDGGSPEGQFWPLGEWSPLVLCVCSAPNSALQHRVHPMWEYSGPKDVTRTKADELSRDEFDTRIRTITNIVGEETPVHAAQPFTSDNPPTEVIA